MGQFWSKLAWWRGRDERRSFQYFPLDPDIKEVRLLCLWPAFRRSAKVKCSIYYTPLETTHYAALSYTWGDPTIKRPIWLNGCEFQVTTNLESALRHLRRRFLPLFVWVDAICINQDDTAERAQQVLLMRNIYSKAYVVLVWLGEATADTHKTLKLVQAVAKKFRQSNYRCTEDFLAWITATTVSLGFRDCYWAALADLFRRAWWTRIWVVQEVVVSDQALLMCGRNFLAFSDFFVLGEVLHNCLPLFTTIQVGNIDHTDHEEIAHMLSVINGLEKGKEIIKVLRVAMEEVSGDPPYETLRNLLRKFRHYQSTDPRDKIYALFGLNPEYHEIKPDYDISAEQLYCRLARAYLELERRVDILLDCEGPSGRSHLPSWTPDWSAPLSVFPLDIVNHRTDIVFRASGSSDPSIRLSDSDNLLVVNGICLDEVLRCGETNSTRSSLLQMEDVPKEEIGSLRSNGEFVREWLSCMQEKTVLDTLLRSNMDADAPNTGDHNDDILNMPYLAGGTILEAFERTILAKPNGPAKVEFEEVAGHPFPGLDVIPGLKQTWGNELRSGLVCSGRRFYLSKKGYMGLAPAQTREDDLISIFLGLSSPVIIRREDDDCYIIIGECYVQGIMNGEAMKDLEDGKLELREFVLK